MNTFAFPDSAISTLIITVLTFNWDVVVFKVKLYSQTI